MFIYLLPLYRQVHNIILQIQVKHQKVKVYSKYLQRINITIKMNEIKNIVDMSWGTQAYTFLYINITSTLLSFNLKSDLHGYLL